MGDIKTTIAEVNTDFGSLNVRSGQGTDTDIIGSVSKGATLEVMELDDGSGWTKVQTSDGKEGYVSSDYIKVETKITDEIPETSSKEQSSEETSTSSFIETSTSSIETEFAEVNTSGGTLNVRSGQGTDSNIIGTASNGEKLQILETDNGSGWTKVQTSDGKEGYVSTEYIKSSTTSEQASGEQIQNTDSSDVNYVRKETLDETDPRVADSMNPDFMTGDDVYYDTNGNIQKVEHVYDDGTTWARYYDSEGNVDRVVSRSGSTQYYAKEGEVRFVPFESYDVNDENARTGSYWDDQGNYVGDGYANGRVFKHPGYENLDF